MKLTRARVRFLGNLAIVETEEGGVALIPKDGLEGLAEKLGLCYENMGVEKCSE